MSVIKRRYRHLTGQLRTFPDSVGEVLVRELQQLDPDTVAIFNPLGAQATGMITERDTEMIGAALENNSTAAAMLFENPWTIGFKEAALRANGRVDMQESIRHEVVVEALADMEQLGSEAIAVSN